MTTPAAPSRPGQPGLRSQSHRVQFIRFPIAVSLLELSAVFLVSALVDLGDNGNVTLEFLAAAAVCGAVGLIEIRRVAIPRVSSAPAVMTMATLSFITMALGGAIAHLISDATDDWDTAVLEGTAPITTTAMTGLDLGAMPDGLLMFRALMQWIGGLGGLIVALIVLPLVFGGADLAGRGPSDGGGRALIRGRTQGFSKLLAIYVGFTVVMAVAYLAADMGWFDAVATAMATVSTGGLGTRNGSLAAFDSASIEWVATVGMAVAGLNIGVIWWILRGDRKPLTRSSELKLYLAVMAASIVAIALWLSSDLSNGASVRASALAVTSAMSTTGFTSAPWWFFDNGAQALLLALIGVGAMAGSAGGGFRYLRLIQAWRFAARELKRQLHPSAVVVVRVNGRAVEERTLQRMTGYIVVFTLTAAAGGMLIELGDTGVTPSSAISLALSALSTAGPQVVDPVDVGSLGAITKLTLSTLMMLGRLSIYTVLLALINGLARAAEHLDRTWRGSAR